VGVGDSDANAVCVFHHGAVAGGDGVVVQDFGVKDAISKRSGVLGCGGE
jgi:hypothetical protein